jgi:hypothetical protein
MSGLSLDGACGTLPTVRNGKRPVAGARRRARRTGIIALALLAATAAAAVELASRYHNVSAAVLVSVLVGVPAFYLAWAAYRDDRRSEADAEAARLSLPEVADELAAAVRVQWQAEAQVRRLNDPYPLPVRWVPADPSLVDEWGLLVTVATSGAGWPPSAGGWADGPAELAGEANQLADVLARVPTGRLVVLGEPGAGKTMLMVRLVLDLLARRSSGGRVPVLVSAASWNPSGQDLRAWLADQLSIGYPGLTAPGPPGSVGATRVEALLGEGFILPILDGLDEIPDAVRGPAIARINDAVQPGEHLVITSRTTPYQDAVRPVGGLEVTLRGAAGITLAALDADVAGSYLRRDAGGPSREALWDPVLAALSTASALARVLSTPLMVGLARAIYNPRPGEHAGALPDPAESCTLPDDKAIESHLFDAFIPAAYRASGTARRGPWSVGQAERWFRFLARHLEHTVSTPDFAWWQLARAMPRRVFATTVGVAAAILFSVPLSGLYGLSAPAPSWSQAGPVALGLVCGFASGVVAWRHDRRARRPSRGMRWSPGNRALRRGLLVGVGGIASGTVVGVLAGVVRPWSFSVVLVLWMVIVGLALGLGSVLRLSVQEIPGEISSARSPRAVLASDRRTALIFGLVTSLVVGLTVGLLIGPLFALLFSAYALHDMLIEGLGWGFSLQFWLDTSAESIRRFSVSDVLGAGLPLGITVAVVTGFAAGRSAWPRWVLTRAWLALHGRLPWRLMAFLADAHRRGVLRQVGAVYQFRHIELQHRLASHPDTPGSPGSPPL